MSHDHNGSIATAIIPVREVVRVARHPHKVKASSVGDPAVLPRPFVECW
jgi:hypothetical protein